jgi:flagellar hook-basal body complex protein FliE
MVDRIGLGGSLAREAISAALKQQAKVAEQINSAASGINGDLAAPGIGKSEATPPLDVSSTFKDGLDAVNGELRASEQLPQKLVEGKINDFHEVAVQVKQADLTFKFALAVRNKLIESYREVMRMHV